MATTRLMPLHTGKGRTVGQAISAIIDYTKNPQKTDGGRLITSWQCDSRVADAEFLFAKNQYTQKTGRVRGEDDVIAYHLRQSFVPGEITPEDANRLGCELAKRFTKGNHAYIVCTHIDKVHIHNHVIWNSTALSQTRKFRNFWGSSRAVRRLNDTICIENGLPINRTDNREALGTIKYAAKLLQKGVVSFGIYPEGTRSKTGELLPFRNGAFQIAKRAGAPIVIVKTSGTELIAHRFARKRTIVRFDVLDVLEGSAVSKLPTREIGDYARSLMLGDIQTTPTEKETNL